MRPKLPHQEFIRLSGFDLDRLMATVDALAKLGGTGTIKLPSVEGPDWPFSVTVGSNGVSVVYGYRAECYSWGSLYPAVPITPENHARQERPVQAQAQA